MIRDAKLNRHALAAILQACAWSALVWAGVPIAAHCTETPTAEFNFAETSRDVPKPRELWPVISKHCIPLDFKILSDSIVDSDTDPAKKLRRVTAYFWSQELPGKKWGHDCTILLPADNAENLKPPRRGKVVVIGSAPSQPFWSNRGGCQELM